LLGTKRHKHRRIGKRDRENTEQTNNKQTNKQQMVVGNDRKERYERKNYL